MPPYLALILSFGLIVYLFRADQQEYAGVSSALWLPLTWMFITVTRMPSQWPQWLSGRVSNFAADRSIAAAAYEEGNGFDRIFYLVVIVMAILILRRRGVVWSRVLRYNLALTVFLAYCLISVIWSDYSFVAFKKWFRDLGIYLTILIAVTDAKPLDSVCLLFRRLAYIVVTLSFTLIKYFPQTGVSYSFWTGQGMWVGITDNKNTLGAVCFASGLLFVWDTLRRHPRNRARIVTITNFVFLAMIAWLYRGLEAKTSLLCFLLGTALLLVCNLNTIQLRPKRILGVVVLGAIVYLFLNYVIGLDSVIYRAAGGDETLTGRTDLWEDILKTNTNPLFGTGYQSYWLGDRLTWLWSRYPYMPNQAHNGYLETYINLGLIGLILLLVFLVATFVKLRTSLITDFQLSILGLTLLVSIVLYSITDAIFKNNFVWYAFLLVTIAIATNSTVPQAAAYRFVRKRGVAEEADSPERRASQGIA